MLSITDKIKGNVQQDFDTYLNTLYEFVSSNLLLSFSPTNYFTLGMSIQFCVYFCKPSWTSTWPGTRTKNIRTRFNTASWKCFCIFWQQQQVICGRHYVEQQRHHHHHLNVLLTFRLSHVFYLLFSVPRIRHHFLPPKNYFSVLGPIRKTNLDIIQLPLN